MRNRLLLIHVSSTMLKTPRYPHERQDKNQNQDGDQNYRDALIERPARRKEGKPQNSVREPAEGNNDCSGNSPCQSRWIRRILITCHLHHSLVSSAIALTYLVYKPNIQIEKTISKKSGQPHERGKPRPNGLYSAGLQFVRCVSISLSFYRRTLSPRVPTQRRALRPLSGEIC